MEFLKQALDQIEIEYNEDHIKKFQRYMELVIEWNEKVNLTAIVEKDDFIRKHFIDSITICSFKQMKEAKKIIDVGTGAGFPGVPLAILNPDKEFVLMDSLNKRLKIVGEMAEEIGIKNITLCHQRAEELGQNKKYREQFDLCASRAVANLSVLSEYCLPFVKVGGWFAAYKSKNTEDEIAESLKALQILGGRLVENAKPEIEGFDFDHRILFISKEKKTPPKYPRRPGTPAKEPLK